MSSLSAHTHVQNIPTGNTPHIRGHFYVSIFVTLTMNDDLLESRHWIKDPGLHGLRTCGWFGLSGEHEFQTQVNGSNVQSCNPVFCKLHLLCCHVWNLTLCSYSRLQKEQVAPVYFIDLSVCSWGHKFHRNLYKWRRMLDWWAVEYFLQVIQFRGAALAKINNACKTKSQALTADILYF